MGNDLDPDQFDASLNFKSVANDLDPDRFDADTDPTFYMVDPDQ